MTEPSNHVPARIRRAYELARARRALLFATPALVFLAILALEGASPLRLGIGVALYVTSALALFLGESAGAAVAPALLFGAVPFGIVRVAESAGHVCMGSACVSWCLPACLAGGLVGGVLVGLRGARATDRVAFTLTAAALVFLAGAVGCDCAGSAGITGVAVGVALGSAVPLLFTRRA